MKREISPVVFVVVIVAALVAVAIWGYRAMQPAPYQMSPGGGPRDLSTHAGAPSPSSAGALSPSSAGAPTPSSGPYGGATPPSYGGAPQPSAGPSPLSAGYQAPRTGSPTSAGSPPPGFKPKR